MASYNKRTTEELKKLRDWPVILPIGSLEQHGPHLPLETDSLLVTDIAEEIGSALEVLVLPTLTYGVSVEHMDFCGTMTLKPETLKETVKDIAASLLAHGFSRLCIINYHGGNKKHLMEILPELESTELNVSLHRVLGRIGLFDHAGEVETSMMLYLHPEQVRKEKIKKFEYSVPEKEGWKTIDHAREGVIGKAEDASAEKGIEYLKKIINELIEEIKDGQDR